MSYVVTGPLALVRNDEGGFTYHYQGAVLPKDVPADEVKRLVETGLVEQEKTAEVPADASRMGTAQTPRK